MKTVRMLRDFPYHARPRVTIQYIAGVTYVRVPEFAVRAIVKAEAGVVIETRQQSEAVIVIETGHGHEHE